MSRPFPLAGLLRVRALAEDTAAAELAAARQAERQARERARTTAQMLGATLLPADADLSAWQASVAARVALSSLLTDDDAAVRVAEEESGRRQEDWTAARIRTRAVERLRDRHDENERLADERTEQNVLDELAARSTAPTAPGEDA